VFAFSFSSWAGQKRGHEEEGVTQLIEFILRGYRTNFLLQLRMRWNEKKKKKKNLWDSTIETRENQSFGKEA
jgi:hypothetical protein